MEMADIEEHDGILSGLLKKNMALQLPGHTIPVAEGSHVFLDSKGRPAEGCWWYDVTIILSEDVELTVGKHTIAVPRGGEVGLHSDLSIEYLSLDKDGKYKVGNTTWPFSYKRAFGDRSRLHFHQSGAIASGHLGRDMDITIGENVYPIKKLSHLYFTDEGLLDVTRIKQGSIYVGLALYKDCEVNVGRHRIILPESSTMSFHKNYSLFQCCLKESFSYETGGAAIEYTSKFKGSPHGSWSADILFHDNGVPLTGFLKEDATLEINGSKASFMKGTQLELYNNSHVCAGYLTEDTELKAGSIVVPCTGDYIKPVVFHRNGCIRKCNPARETVIPAGSTQIKIIPLSNSKRWIDSHMDIYKYDLEFHENGTIACCTPGEDVTIIEKGREVVLRVGKRARFHEDGSLKKDDE